MFRILFQMSYHVAQLPDWGRPPPKEGLARVDGLKSLRLLAGIRRRGFGLGRLDKSQYESGRRWGFGDQLPVAHQLVG